MADKDILACRIASYGKFSLHSYEHLPEIGVKYIERPLPQGGEDVDMLKDILEEFNLDVSSFQMNFTPLDQKEFQAEIDSIIEMSVTFGTKIIFTSIKAPELNLLFYKKKKTKRLFEQLRYLGDQVKSKGIHISLETHPNLVTNGKVGKESMEAINHDNIRINFDTANMYYYNKGIDVVEELDYILPYVKSVHLKDSNKAYHGWDFPA
ncbi:MAG: sugar phosphate isomerase/epimerase family protein, partial [Candidatus Hodarchaeota archaeon]